MQSLSRYLYDLNATIRTSPFGGQLGLEGSVAKLLLISKSNPTLERVSHLFADHLRYVVAMSVMVAGSLLTRVTLTLSPHVLITTIAVIGIAHYTLMYVDKARLRVDNFLHCVEFVREWQSAVDFLRTLPSRANLEERTTPTPEDELMCLDMSDHAAVTGYTEAGMLFIKIKVKRLLPISSRNDEVSDDGDSSELSDGSGEWDVSEFLILTNYNEKRKWEAMKVTGNDDGNSPVGFAAVEVDLVPFIKGLFENQYLVVF